MTQLSNILGGKIWSGRVFLALFLTFSGQTFAALPLATIQDVIFNADGTRFNGVASIEWKSFQAADGSLIAAQSVSVSIINGNLRVRLVPTANASAGARYTVRYSSGGQIRFTEYWSVPISSALLHLRDIRTNSTGQLIGNAAVIEISDVGGLQDELDSRPLRGFGFAPNRVVVSGSTGKMETRTNIYHPIFRKPKTEFWNSAKAFPIAITVWPSSNFEESPKSINVSALSIG